MSTCRDGKGGKLSSRASKMLYKPPGAVYSGASAREARQRSTMGKKNWYPIKPRKFGHDVSVRASERANVRTDSGGGGGASRDIPHNHPYGKLRNAIFPWRVFV